VASGSARQIFVSRTSLESSLVGAVFRAGLVMIPDYVDLLLNGYYHHPQIAHDECYWPADFYLSEAGGLKLGSARCRAASLPDS
jgi:hypothetical protein